MFRTVDTWIEDKLFGHLKVDEKSKLVNKYFEDTKYYAADFGVFHKHRIYVYDIKLNSNQKALYIPHKENGLTISLEKLGNPDSFIVSKTLKLIKYLENR